MKAKITLLDGTIRTARLDGFGCTSIICSRVAIKGKVNDSPVSLRLDSIATIKDVTPSDALIVMKDGAAQRTALITGFRGLYFGDGSNHSEKLDLTRIKSLEFTTGR